MDFVVVLIIFYVIQLGIGVYGYFNIQIRTVSEWKLRYLVLVFAFVPIPGLSVAVQVGAIIAYHLQAVRTKAVGAQLKASAETGRHPPEQVDFDQPENPFDLGDNGHH